VAAVVAVGVAALVDALRPGSDPPLDPAAAAELSGLGIAGVLVYTDAACDLRALSLPELVPAPLPEGPDHGCDISVAPDGRHVAGGGARWRPDSSEYAICRGTRVDVVPAAGGSAKGTFEGCAPAWRPDGMLTLVRDGAIREAGVGEILVPRSEVARSALAHPNAPAEARLERVVVRDLAWLSGDQAVVLIETRYVFGLTEAETTLAGFRGGRLVWQRPYFSRFERLAISRGGNILLEPADPPQIAFFAPRLDPAGPIAWSPNGSWLAVATRASVFVVDTSAARRVRIPVTARDLAWR
jgi:hypothetical protein